jgi:hypothetical protein
MKITIEQSFTKNDLLNIMTTGLEGGIGYWACLNNDTPEFDEFDKLNMLLSERVAEILWRGGSVELFDTDYNYNDADKWELTLDKVVKGIIKFMETDSKTFEIDDLDALDCDKIIQYGLFGELVFG